MSDKGFAFLLGATDEEFDAYIDCPHTGATYTEPGPLTGRPYVRCAACHSVVARDEYRGQR